MKAVLALLLVAGALSSPLTLSQFLAGYTEGLQEAEGCLEDLATCGEAMGRLAASLRSYVSSKPLEALGISTAEVEQFVNGLVDGLREDPNSVSPCVSDFSQGSYQATTLYNALVALLQNFADWPEIVSVSCSGVSLLGYNFIDDCHFDKLWLVLKGMSLDLVLRNYLSNSCDINTAFIQIVNCSSSLSWCGFSIGVVVREITGWGI